MSARRHLIAALSEDSMGGIATLHDVDRAEKLVDGHRTEVLAEVVRWLGKKSREFHAIGTRKSEAQANAVAAMASKISRGAVRPDNVRMLPDAGFFEVDRTYRREHHGQPITFVVTAISTSPDGRCTVAHGWRTDPYSGWEPTDADDFTGWAEVTEDGAR